MLRFILIVALVVILFVVLIQLLAKYNVISYKMRISIGIALLVFSIGIGIFTHNQDKNEAHLIQLTQTFLQGKALQCQVGTKTLEVSNKTFNFISGTLTLMGKEESEYKHMTIPLKACNTKES
ncbi:hypothetical protein [Helicobacter turcicus]|uniref:DUF2393 domain-containing protein n=1 Tax=Helicobacter turcicus TaxID=2867412 RepID=A0ABS7JLF1_9HELI|nr:hypothetical protein [Helicobacter turcicus]MBX7490196.1 hypothetical protein [Helicobacter turcicus]MBX7545225.1 hypothetical protein [Helicobacter turcicus]